MKLHQIKHYNLKMAKLPPLDVTLLHGTYLHVVIFSKNTTHFNVLVFSLSSKTHTCANSNFTGFLEPPLFKTVTQLLLRGESKQGGMSGN